MPPKRPAPKNPKVSNADALLFALIRQVPQHGWTDDVLRAAVCKTIQLQDLMRTFPGGIPDALRAFAAYAERDMLEKLSTHPLIKMRVRDRVQTAVWLWLETMAPHRDAVAAAVRSAWWPGHAVIGVQSLAKLCDVIWVEAGDTATDYNRYTKRGLLALVFASTLIFWLQDRSPKYDATRAFLSARIDNALAVGQAAAQFKNLKSFLTSLRSF